MPKICYEHKEFRGASLAIVQTANDIIAQYHAQGFDLTLRQLYYQFVSRAIIANKDTEYKRLGSIINDARLAGLIDWNSIVDRTRNLQSNSHWTSPDSIISSAVSSYREDVWDSQPHNVEVWIEKDALSGVISGVCQRLDVPYFSCRGYTSQSEMWSAAMRIVGKLQDNKHVTIIHLGDHDPSGIDMTRDIEDRLRLFTSKHVSGSDHRLTINRIALNMDQVRQYNPPPNPAKLTDARAAKYVEEYGDDSWELDALEPSVMVGLIEEAVTGLRDADEWEEAVKVQEKNREVLTWAGENWERIEELKLESEGE